MSTNPKRNPVEEAYSEHKRRMEENKYKAGENDNYTQQQGEYFILFMMLFVCVSFFSYRYWNRSNLWKRDVELFIQKQKEEEEKAIEKNDRK